MKNKDEWFQNQMKENLANPPMDKDKSSVNNRDRQLLRLGIQAELDAINLYEQMADTTDDEFLKKVFLDIAKEEKTHIGEFQELLIRFDGEHAQELENGKEEINELSKE